MLNKSQLLVVFIIVTLLSNIASAALNIDSHEEKQLNANASEKKWTWMFYDDADFNGGDVFDEFSQEAFSGINLSVIVLQDTNYESAKMWYIDENHNKTLLQELGEVDMGSYITLRDFLNYGKENFPADRYLLSVYDHGNGWKGACSDITNNNWLTMNEFQKALGESGGVDILCFTGPCVMGAVESVYELKNSVDIYIGAEEGSSYCAWRDIIFDICDMLNNNSDISNLEIGKQIIQLIQDNPEGCPNNELLTMSAIRTDKITNLTQAIDNASKIFCSNIEEYRDDVELAYSKTELFGNSGDIMDIYDFAENYCNLGDTNVTICNALISVMNAVNDTVIAECHGENKSGAHGLMIYSPITSHWTYDPRYDNVDYGLDFTNDTHWDDFLINYMFSFKVNVNGGADFAKIQDAINNAKAGDGIYVYSGVYNENIVISKTVDLVGENRYTTIIDGRKNGNVVTVSDFDRLGGRISDFNIQNSGNRFFDSGIKSYNKLGNDFTFNAITGNKNGICLINSSNNYISNNIVTGSKNAGILLLKNSKNNRIQYNNITNNRRGIYLRNSENNEIACNNFIKNFRNAYFYKCKNTWENNYWNEPKSHPKIVFGIGTIRIFGRIHWLNFDNDPASYSYKIDDL